MSFANLKVPAGSLTLEQRQQLVARVTDLFAESYGEHTRPDPMVLVSEVAASTAAAVDRAPGIRRVEQAMGMPVILDIRDPFPAPTLRALAEKVFGWLRKVDALFSTSSPDSQVSLLDQGMIRPTQADPLVREVLSTCARLHRRTNGFFDVYVNGRLDPTGHVTGWAIQRASAMLVRAGAVNHRLQAGSDLYVAGRPAPGRSWNFPIHDPLHPDTPAWAVAATDLAVATSSLAAGDQIHNPVTRLPATGLASVTVAGPDLGVADAYATAASAMGHAALDWLPQLEDHAYVMIDDRGHRYEGAPAISPWRFLR